MLGLKLNHVSKGAPIIHKQQSSHHEGSPEFPTDPEILHDK